MVAMRTILFADALAEHRNPPAGDNEKPHRGMRCFEIIHRAAVSQTKPAEGVWRSGWRPNLRLF
jgi:hypothetical protein